MLNSLRQNNRATEAEAFQDFESAVERTSWVKAGSCRVNFGSGRWESATLELEQSGTTNGGASGLTINSSKAQQTAFLKIRLFFGRWHKNSRQRKLKLKHKKLKLKNFSPKTQKSGKISEDCDLNQHNLFKN